MKRFLPSLIFILFLMIPLFLPMVVLADPPGGGCDPFDPLCPIDGGLSLLIAAGIGLGAKKAYHERKILLANKD